MVVYSPWGLKELDTTEVTGQAYMQYSIVYMYHIFFIHLSVDRHLGYFRVLAVANSATVNVECMYLF